MMGKTPLITMNVPVAFARAFSASPHAPRVGAIKTTSCALVVLEEIALKGAPRGRCARAEIVINVVLIIRIAMAVDANKKTLSDHNAPFEPTALEIVI